ncbi:MAG: dihydroorotase [Planctomycetota bacterium]|nr:dihydroorotase [Planctomycetota bacterium]
MSSYLIMGGRVIDPASGFDAVTNVLIEDGKVKTLGSASPRGYQVIDARGKVVAPGLIDMHTHLREPGKEDEETIASGAAAAVAGGFASVASMPNTDPPIDNEAMVEFIYLQAKRCGKANVFAIAAATKGRKGEELSEIGQLVRGGAVAFSDDGNSIANADVMRRVLQYAGMFDKAVISHCEDRNLSRDGVMNEGYMSTVLGLPGMPAIAEETMVHRDIMLAAATGSKVHIAHVSTAVSVELVRRAKEKGIRVTTEATPHHLVLDETALRTFDPNFKMSPPLRTKKDVEALRRGLTDGTIDAIASDHAPHSSEEKDVEFSAAPFGVIGLETTLPIVLTELVGKNVLSLNEAVARLTLNPARILGIPRGTLSAGAVADVTVIDLDKEIEIDPSRFISKSRNCPFAGRKLRGCATVVLVGGRIVSGGNG